LAAAWRVSIASAAPDQKTCGATDGYSEARAARS